MKKTFYLLPLLLIVGCVNIKELPGYKITTWFDFSEYTKKGFIFTQEQWLEPYEPMGLISTRFSPAIIKKVPPKEKDNYDEISFGFSVYAYIQKINSKSALDELYNKAISMGANAVVRLEIKSEKFFNETIPYDVLTISGFAIKRK